MKTRGDDGTEIALGDWQSSGLNWGRVLNFFSKSTCLRTLSISSGLTFLKKFFVLTVGEICGLWKSSSVAEVGVGSADGIWVQDGGCWWVVLPLLLSLLSPEF